MSVTYFSYIIKLQIGLNKPLEMMYWIWIAYINIINPTSQFSFYGLL